VVVVWQSAPPGQRRRPECATAVHRRTDGPAHDDEKADRGYHRPAPLRPLSADSVRRHFSAGLSFTPPEHEEGLRCHYDAGNYQLAVEPIIWRKYEQSLPADAVETTINGHRAAQWWNLKPTYHNSYWYFSCMVAFKTSYGVIQQSLYYSTVYSSPEVDCPSTNLQRANELSPYYVF
jgi:hypothetical protein